MAHSFDTDAEAQGLIDFVDASPSPFHAVRAGGSAASPRRASPRSTRPSRGRPSRGGATSCAAARSSPGTRPARTAPAPAGRGVPRRRGAHRQPEPADQAEPRPRARRLAAARRRALRRAAPQLLARPRPRPRPAGWPCAGRTASSRALFLADDPLLRVAAARHPPRPRAAERRRCTLNLQQHLAPVWGLGDAPGDFRAYLAEQVDVGRRGRPRLGRHDPRPSSRRGGSAAARELVAAPRLDNLRTSYAGVAALLRRRAPPSRAHVPVLVLFDHEEIGSQSDRGAPRRCCPACSSASSPRAAAAARTTGAPSPAPSSPPATWRHATHPNYADRHEPQHLIALNGGPVLKVNTKLRYATDAVGAAAFTLPASRPGSRCSATSPAATCPAGSHRRPDHGGADRRDDRGLRGADALDAQQPRALRRRSNPRGMPAALAAFLAPADGPPRIRQRSTQPGARRVRGWGRGDHALVPTRPTLVR